LHISNFNHSELDTNLQHVNFMLEWEFSDLTIKRVFNAQTLDLSFAIFMGCAGNKKYKFLIDKRGNFHCTNRNKIYTLCKKLISVSRWLGEFSTIQKIHTIQFINKKIIYIHKNKKFHIIYSFFFLPNNTNKVEMKGTGGNKTKSSNKKRNESRKNGILVDFDKTRTFWSGNFLFQ
jgi:hypothetical protein